MTINPATAATVIAVCTSIGVIINVLQASLQQPWWPARAKALLTVGFSVIAAVAAYVVTNGVTWASWPDLILWFVGVFNAAVIAYHGLGKHLPLLAKLELATSPPPPEPLSNEEARQFEETAVSADPNLPVAVAPVSPLDADPALVGPPVAGEEALDTLLATDGTENILPYQAGAPYHDGRDPALTDEPAVTPDPPGRLS